jgi:hypothetical protein
VGVGAELNEEFDAVVGGADLSSAPVAVVELAE